MILPTHLVEEVQEIATLAHPEHPSLFSAIHTRSGARRGALFGLITDEGVGAVGASLAC